MSIQLRLGMLCVLLALLQACGGSSSSSSGGSTPEAIDTDSDGIVDADDNCPAVANPNQLDTDDDGAGDACDADDARDSDEDGIVNSNDLCAATPAGASIDDRGCADTQVNASCGDSFATQSAGRHYPVTLQSASGETISFEVFEPATLRCGARSLGAHPLVLQGHGFGGSRVSDPASGDYASTGIETLVNADYAVISIDLRGFGQSSGTVRVMDPDFEGLDLVQIVDWAEQNLDYLAWRDNASGDYAGRPDSAESTAGGVNLLLGSIGSSYGGGYQMLLHAVDEKQRLDAMVPDITWHHLPYSLNPGDAIKATWSLLLVAGGEAGSYGPGLEGQDSPFSRGLDPYVKETLLRGITLNEFPRDAIDWFAYHSPSYWCGLNSQPTMPYSVAESELNNNLTGQIEVAPPGSNTYTGQPGVDVLITQGIRDTLFNFNDAWWNYQCLSQRAESNGAEVRLLTHESGHIISGFIGETPEPLYFQAPGGNFACGSLSQRDAQFAWLQEKLRGVDSAGLLGEGLCLSLADDDAVYIDDGDFKARRANGVQPAFYGVADVAVDNVPNGVEAQVAHLLGQAAQIVPLLTVDDEQGVILAGIPQLDITLSTPQMLNDEICTMGTIPTLRLGCDAIMLVGLAVQRDGGDWALIDDQMMPVRGLGEHVDIDMVGIAERLLPGDTLGFWVSGYHPQYIESFSRDVTIPLVNVSADLRLPLYAVDSAGQPDPQMALTTAVSELSEN